MPGLRRINHTKSDPRTRRGMAILAQEADLIFGDGLETGPIDGITRGSFITINLATPSGLIKNDGLAIDPKTSGGMAIDTDGLYIVLDTPVHGLHMSLGASGLSIDDDYVFNTGDVINGDLEITGLLTAGGLKVKYAEDNVADPPIDSQLDTAFGTPAALGAGYIGILDDNSADTDVYICFTNDTSWWLIKGTKAVISAIDTAEKRRSISGIPLLIPGVTPNVGKDQEWRQEAGWCYSGIEVDSP